MNTTLETALLALVPVCMLLAGSAVLFSSRKTVASFLQLFGAGCLVIVALTHLSEALHLFPSMNWGRPHSIGHYLDFWSAVLGLTLFPFGYLFNALTKP
jgi:zinc transporter ZupT